MKFKSALYVGLVVLSMSSGLTSATSMAAAQDESSSSSQSTSSTTSSALNSSPELTSSTANDNITNKQATKTSVVSPQDDTEPSAPTAATDGVQTPSWNGVFLGILGIGIPIIGGFQTQPQAEQYIVANKSGIGTADMSFMTSAFGSLLGSTNKVTETLWTWVPAEDSSTGAAHWQRTLESATKSNWNLPFVGNSKFNNDRKLPIGKYYVQYKGAFNGVSGTKTSQLSKIDVVKAPINADSIKPTVPRVIFANAAYNGSAVTKPTNATGKITWNSDVNGLTWNQQNGRTSNFIIDNDKQTTQVNTSTTDPGILANFNAYIANTTSSGSTINLSNKANNSYIGGLVAKEMVSDAGGTWSLDDGGLADLEAAVNPQNSTGVTWNYQWQVSTDGGKNFTNVTTSDNGVSNFSGTVTNVTDLTKPENTLTFSRTSGFMNKAAAATTSGHSYVMRETLKTTIPKETTGADKDTIININSNSASLTVAQGKGYLLLDSVPDFNFGDVKATDVYNGTSGKITSKNSTLAVTDSRTTITNKYWTVHAKMTRMADDSGNQLATPTTKISLTGVLGGHSITDDGRDNMIKNSTGGSYTQSNVNGTLTLRQNHQIKLADNQRFSSNITWVLAGAKPNATALK